MIKNISAVLINLPIPFVDDDERQPPGGLVSIATYVKSKGFDITICDLSGLAEDVLMDHIPDAEVYGIGIYSATYELALELLGKLKDKYAKALFVAGGPHASALPELVSESFEVVVTGEGEFAFHNILEKFQKGQKVSGIIEANVIENLDELPFPDYEYFCDMSKYTRRIDDAQVICLDSSRGCNFKCRFCNSIVHKRGYWRARSAENVFSEVKNYYDNGWRAIRFNDDNFLVDKKRAIKICELIKPLNIKWRIFSRAESLSSDICKCLFEAGCVHVSVGIESLSPVMLAKMGKETSIEKIKTGINNAYNAGIQTRGFFIVGFPGETDETVNETINYLKEIRLTEATVYPCIAYPGTDLYERPNYYQLTWIDDDFSNFIQVGKGKSTGFVIRTKYFGEKEIQNWRSKLMEALDHNAINWCDEAKTVV